MPPPAARSTAHVVAAAAIGSVASVFGFVAVAIAAAALSGRTIAGGERAVVGAAIADVVIVLGVTIALAYYARHASAWARWLTVAAFAVAQSLAGAAMLLLTVVMLNR